MKIKTIANSYLVLALLTGALVPVMLDIGGASMPIPEFLFLTYLFAVPASLVFVLMNGKREKLVAMLKNRKDLAVVSVIGILNYFFLEYGLTYAEKFVSASLATVIYRSFPIIMFLFLPFVLRERVSRVQVIALALAFFGFLIAFTGGNLTFGVSAADGYIILFLIFITVMSALSSTLVKRYVFDMESSMFVFNLANFFVFAIMFATSLGSGVSIALPSTGALLAILYVGIVYNVLTGFMYSSALRMIKTTLVTNFYFLSPFITFGFAALILGEPIKFYYLIIALFVSAGIIIQKFDKVGSSYLSREEKKLKYLIYDISSAFVNTKDRKVYGLLKGDGRVLAVKVEKGWHGRIDNLVAGMKNGGSDDYINMVSVYTDLNRDRVSKEESTFIRDIMGVKDNETALICAGKPEHGERFFNDLAEIAERMERENTDTKVRSVESAGPLGPGVD